MKKQIAVLLTDAVLNLVGFVAIAVLFPVLLMLTPLINALGAIIALCVLADILYAALLSGMANKAMGKCGVGFWRYTLFSVITAFIVPFGIASFCLVEWLNRPPVSYGVDLFIAVCAFASVVVVFLSYVIFHTAKKSREA